MEHTVHSVYKTNHTALEGRPEINKTVKRNTSTGIIAKMSLKDFCPLWSEKFSLNNIDIYTYADKKSNNFSGLQHTAECAGCCSTACRKQWIFIQMLTKDAFKNHATTLRQNKGKISAGENNIWWLNVIIQKGGGGGTEGSKQSRASSSRDTHNNLIAYQRRRTPASLLSAVIGINPRSGHLLAPGFPRAAVP